MNVRTLAAGILGCCVFAACSSSEEVQNPGGDSSGGRGGSAGKDGGRGGSSGKEETGGSGGTLPVEAGTGGTSDCAENADKIFLVSAQNTLHSFDPGAAGLASYQSIGTLQCSPSAGAIPQSMAVDRTATAWVFYHSGELFQVSTRDASCTKTAYVHPAQDPSGFNNLGMAFTAQADKSAEQVLFVLSPAFGLATVDTQSFAVTNTGKYQTLQAELTGGPDAKLFLFDRATATLSEVDRTTYNSTPVRPFPELQAVEAWAFARHTGIFYLFTARRVQDVLEPTATTMFDPVAGQVTVRDTSIGFTVVGAGQSTCVPPPPVL